MSLRFSALPLAASVAAALGATVAHAKQSASTHDTQGLAAPTTWVVSDCSDDAFATNTLRFYATLAADNGDTIDVSACANSTITLTAGEIPIVQDDLTIQGDGSVTISGAGQNRIFNHSGSGRLTIDGLIVSDGYYAQTGDYQAVGGCIKSLGEVVLSHSTVTGCSVTSHSRPAYGGGIYTRGIAILESSVLSDNKAFSEGSGSAGGGVYASGGLLSKYSLIHGNSTAGGSSSIRGGGARVRGTATYIVRSTISDNYSGGYGGGLSLYGSAIPLILNSTISGNVAISKGAGLSTNTPDGPKVINSTIAFNHAGDDGGGVNANGSGNFEMQSTIVAKNVRGTASVPSDLSINFGMLTGADNLVMQTNVAPPGVISVTQDPLLMPLAFSGGVTPVHMLRAGSPALGMGNNQAGQTTDQRGAGYPRTTGAAVDIGAIQFDTIFLDGFD